MSTIAVTGAAGVLGREIVASLQRRGADVVGIVRRGAAGSQRNADLALPSDVAAALDGIRTIVHAASSPLSDRSVETRYLGNVVDVAKRTGAHVVYVSIVNVHRNNAYGYYAAKRDGELLLERSGVPYTIQRAAQFHPFLDYIFRLVTKAPIAVLPPGSAFEPIDVAACAERFAALALSPPGGIARDIVGPETADVRDFYNQWRRSRNVRTPLVLLPLPIPAFRVIGHRRLISDEPDRLGASFTTWLAATTSEPNPYAAKQRQR